VEHVQQSITKAAPTSDDRLAAELRRFGLLGIIAILLILFTGNIVLGPIRGAGRRRSGHGICTAVAYAVA
jgi:hypothetical protein